jgi:hypothetical protein
MKHGKMKIDYSDDLRIKTSKGDTSMKRMVIFTILAVAAYLGTATMAQAYTLDSPHNESNGIYCSTCHNNPNNASMSWGDEHNGTGNIDITRRNAVCRYCHDATDINNLNLADFAVKPGPIKSLHASSTTSTAKGTWSVQCTDCHDVHAQDQLTWATADYGNFWLADGDIDYMGGPEAPFINFADPDADGYPSTTVGISFVGGKPGWSDPMTWTAKGLRNMDPTRAVDNSRGLLFVPSKDFPTESFEIIKVEDLGSLNYRIKLKGQATSLLDLEKFGVFYGQLLKSEIINPSTLIPTDVKFFKPDVPNAAPFYGSWVDVSGSTPLVGICQSCHTLTGNWGADGSGNTHYGTTDCVECHNPINGLPPEGGHVTAFIDDRLGSGCSSCHAAYTAAADSAHSGGCTTCHTTAPAIADSSLPNDGPTTILAGLADNTITGEDYNFGGAGGRLQDSLNNLINDGGFAVLDCRQCHPSHLAGNHGGHTAADWDFAAVTDDCVDCHTDGGLGTVEGVHSGNCDLCHLDEPGGDYTRIAGTDGSALLMSGKTGTCTVCHPGGTYTPPFIHHDTAPAQAGNCTINCHNNAGHTGDHQSFVVDVAPCSSCHTGTAPTDANNVPVNSATPAGDMVHDACVDCHDIASTIMALNGPTGSAAAMRHGPRCLCRLS